MKDKTLPLRINRAVNPIYTTKHKILNTEYSKMRRGQGRRTLKFNCIILTWLLTTERKMSCAQEMQMELQA